MEKIEFKIMVKYIYMNSTKKKNLLPQKQPQMLGELQTRASNVDYMYNFLQSVSYYSVDFYESQNKNAQFAVGFHVCNANR